ncbi:hypothetical protein MC7420_201 [Coleofasciculus chthonoplastes PCC 7420]|uniref:Uncharacterized protein n=1 Tax=Coleofasciculus chthonoplastes PCC 7420 TaxID=118168 RepID=B4VL44_9CYAN|nr:hypothetical protein MC7420_201 [Coleofasciculus chthonoplastes PCC 7420]
MLMVKPAPTTDVPPERLYNFSPISLISLFPPTSPPLIRRQSLQSKRI